MNEWINESSVSRITHLPVKIYIIYYVCKIKLDPEYYEDLFLVTADTTDGGDIIDQIRRKAFTLKKVPSIEKVNLH